MTEPAPGLSKKNVSSASVLSVVRTIEELRERISAARLQPVISVGLVATMGFFHDGHLSLIQAAREECSFVVVSIFVNPGQFGPTEDLDSYPHDLERDLTLAAGAGVDLVFAPEAEEIYPPGHETTVEPGSAAEGMCGSNRPGHFRGVATVVTKLFNIIEPDVAYFGQKDAQQVAVVRQLVRDLNFDIDIKVCPTVREDDGLAMSSRNSHLSAEERQQATALFVALTTAREAIAAGEKDAVKIRRRMRRVIGQNYLAEFEYARIVNPETMEPVASIENTVLAAVAARVGRTRLIDNMLVTP